MVVPSCLILGMPLNSTENMERATAQHYMTKPLHLHAMLFLMPIRSSALVRKSKYMHS